MIKVYVRARAEGGKANRSVSEVIAEALRIAKSGVKILSTKSRTKLVEIPDACLLPENWLKSR